MEPHLQSLTAYFSAHPYLALCVVFAAALLEALAVIGTVVPGSTIVFLGGALIGLGALDAGPTAAAVVLGAILGDGASYWLGRHWHERIRSVWPMKNHPSLFARGEAFFHAHGGKSVFLGRFIGPMRAIVPVVAGMTNMPPTAFYIMNVLSAVAWCAAHLIPGALFGASMQLAGAVSSRLVLLIVLFTAVLWTIAKLVQWVVRYASPRLAALRARVIERVRGRPGMYARTVLSLFDPSRAESPALLTAALLLVGGAWIFLGIVEDVVSRDPLVQLDQTIFSLLQRMRTGWTDDLMITVTGLGGAAATIPVVIAIAVLFALRRQWRTLGYWLAAPAFAEVAVWTLKSTIGRTRPSALYTGIEQFSFPSGHAASSIVVYGFMAFLLAREKAVKPRMAIVLSAALWIALIAFSRLYLGAHWFSDVMASLALGLAWVALLAIAYTHHVRDEPVRAAPMLLVVATTLALVGASFVRMHHGADVERYRYRPASENLPLDAWKRARWQSLPAARSELAGETEEPFSVQWAGSDTEIVRALTAAGWQPPRPWASRGTLLWLLPHPAIEALPVLPKFDRGEAQRLTFVKIVSADERLVIRLWRSSRNVLDVAVARALWQGMVTIERLSRPAGMITIALTVSDFVSPLRSLEKDLQQARISIRLREGGTPVVLVW